MLERKCSLCYPRLRCYNAVTDSDWVQLELEKDLVDKYLQVSLVRRFPLINKSRSTGLNFRRTYLVRKCFPGKNEQISHLLNMIVDLKQLNKHQHKRRDEYFSLFGRQYYNKVVEMQSSQTHVYPLWRLKPNSMITLATRHRHIPLTDVSRPTYRLK